MARSNDRKGRARRPQAARRTLSAAANGNKRAAPSSGHPSGVSSEQMTCLRDLFWNNVIRDMLNGLSTLLESQPELFDGRFGVLTRHGERIPIAHVHPLFACSIPGSQAERDMSAAVQCTVFRITTPEGEVFTLPVQEIRAIHTMTPELIEQLQALAEKEAEGEDEASPDAKPFGLAAFTALPKPPVIAAPDHPTE